MYFWNIKALKKQLVNQGLTQRQLFYYILIYLFNYSYILAYAVYSSAIAEGSRLSPNYSQNAWGSTESILSILIIVLLGTFALYRANGGNSGTQFAEKYFSLVIAGGFRFSVFSSFLLFAAGIIAASFPSIFDNLTVIEGDLLRPTGYLVVLGFVYSVLLFIYIGKHIRDVARATSGR